MKDSVRRVEISGFELKLANAKSRGGIEDWLGA
jgi:hypothetical protein